MRLDIAIDELLPGPVERVWRAFTDPQMLARWLMATDDFEPRVGASFVLRDESPTGCRGEVHCEVLELAPPHRLVWSWRAADDPGPTRLVIELEADGDATRLKLRHTGEADEPTITGTTAGWTRKLEQLVEALAPASHEMATKGANDG
jgi:uncharacterized protein YndB with AHSA1/START domain